jgi:hypothetical protein
VVAIGGGVAAVGNRRFPRDTEGGSALDAAAVEEIVDERGDRPCENGQKRRTDDHENPHDCVLPTGNPVANENLTSVVGIPPRGQVGSHAIS